MIAIARAVTQKARLVIMDEPTSSLDEREVAILFETIRTLKNEWCCRAVHSAIGWMNSTKSATASPSCATARRWRTAPWPTCRRWSLSATCSARNLPPSRRFARDRGDDEAKPVRLSVDNAGSGVRVRDVSMSVREGEISGLAGLLGSGRTETARIIFGVDKLQKGLDTHRRQGADLFRTSRRDCRWHRAGLRGPQD